MAHTVELNSPACAPASRFELEADVDASPSTPGSRYEEAVLAGFRWLRFPAALEAEFQADLATQREKLLRIGTVLALVLTICLILPDWLMVPDMLDSALQLRLLVYALPTVVWLLLFDRMEGHWREWFAVVMSSISACITAWLCVRSTDMLAPAYFVSLAMILLFNSGVTRMRFWAALVADMVILLVYAVALTQLDPMPTVLMIAVSLILVSTALFGLFGSYWLEHEQRANWLMLQHEHLLLAEVEKGNRRLDALSRHDALTGLANRRHVDEFLQQVWDRARKAGDEVAVLMMDIDHFKAFNDHYGHPEGDACLRDVAQAIEAYLRQPGDLVGRFGGEEFIAVMNKTTLAKAMAAADRIHQGVRQLARPHAASSTSAIVSISIGAAAVHPGRHERTPERLLALADQAMYQAKSQGRDRVACLSDQG